jgi:hypothetical protein
MTEPTITADDRLAELERLMAEQLRARDPATATLRALSAPRILTGVAHDREQRDLAAARARQAVAEERAQAIREQAIKDEPLKVARDLKIEELQERRDQAIADADRLYLEADRLSGQISAIMREPLSPEAAALPPINEPSRPIASMGVTSDLFGGQVQMEPAAKAKFEAARAANIAAQGMRR